MTPPAQRCCFDAQDTGPIGGDDKVEWIPQGVTTVADAQQDELLRTTDARLAGIGPEDLSSWPGHKEVWTVTEHAGRRVLYAVPG